MAIMPPDWRIYYDDGSMFDSTQGEPHEAPPEGFICAVGYNENGKRYIMHKWDFYCWDLDNAQWWGMDIFGLMDRLRRNKVYAFKEGRTITADQWSKISMAAADDPEFPVKRLR